MPRAPSLSIATSVASSSAAHAKPRCLPGGNPGTDPRRSRFRHRTFPIGAMEFVGRLEVEQKGVVRLHGDDLFLLRSYLLEQREFAALRWLSHYQGRRFRRYCSTWGSPSTVTAICCRAARQRRWRCSTNSTPAAGNRRKFGGAV
jgi:hypothetical protein